MTTEVTAPVKPQKTSPSKRKSTTAAAPQATSSGAMPKVPSLLQERYEKSVKDELRKQFSYGNVMQVPRIEKIVLNIGMGESIGNAKTMDAAANDLAIITGQRPIVTKSRKAISNFRLRVGMPIGLKVTLRGPQMWHFLEKLVTVALPRIRDFQGIPERSFDGRGNYSLGLKEQLVFPEIEYDKIDRLRGLEITIVTTARNDEEGRALLKALGMPFRTRDAQGGS
jgi:large subunit ribosomal protein L5